MIQFDRLQFETQQLEEKLNGVYRTQHEAVISHQQPQSLLLGSKRLRWMSASIWFREQMLEPDGPTSNLPEPQMIQEEFAGEVRAILSEYGNLSLEGLRLFLAFLAVWLLIQDHIIIPMNLHFFSELILGTMILYPIVAYTFWNWGSIHPFKALKLIIGAIGALTAGIGSYLLSVFDRENPFFADVLLAPFNYTELLILVNLIIFLSFIIHYRRENLFSEVCMNYQRKLVSLSGLSIAAQNEISGLMKELEAVPLKTQTRRRLKTRILAGYFDSGGMSDLQVKDFIRVNCIDMNWMYWVGSVAQWTIIVLLISKLVWAYDTGLMVSDDYFRQDLTTGMVLGAILLSAAVFCPLNRCFRELLYRGSAFSLKQAWMLMGLALLCVSVILLSGLIPSRFAWGIPMNPAPHIWGLIVMVGVVLLVQFFKSDPKFQNMETKEK